MSIESSLRRWGAEVLLALVAGAAFLGFLGSTELWGKREQRASAEALDTVDHGRWLVAQIQGRPRLEKPPLPRWITSALMVVTHRRDELIVRLPNALAGLATVSLIYWLGRAFGGRSVGLASGFALASSFNFLVEMRQAGNDGFLALFTTLALLAAWKRLNGPEPDPDEVAPEFRLGRRSWSLLFYGALGLGFLTKGPVILLLVGLTVVGYLATSRRLKLGLRALADGWGLVGFLILALAWPVPVLLRDPTSARVWWFEMAQKTGALDLPHEKVRESIALDWFGMTMPWTPLALIAAAWPLRKSSRLARPELAFAWWWAIGNLVVLSCWKVAKPSYYLPCLPGVALLVGSEWVRLTRLARRNSPGSTAARGFLQVLWVALFVTAAVAPVLVGKIAPDNLIWANLGALALATAVVVAAWIWRRGGEAGALIPLSISFVILALIGYGAIAPAENRARGHRELASRLKTLVPGEVSTLWFFNEIDEGLWFYLEDTRELTPIAAAKVNRGFDLRVEAAVHQIDTPARRVEQARDQLTHWAGNADPKSPYLLIRAKVYDRFANEVASLVEPVYRETEIKRSEMVLLRARTATQITAKARETPRR